jgi:hypothetical protein
MYRLVLTFSACRVGTPEVVVDIKRRYSEDLYKYTLSVWNENRADIE